MFILNITQKVEQKPCKNEGASEAITRCDWSNTTIKKKGNK